MKTQTHFSPSHFVGLKTATNDLVHGFGHGALKRCAAVLGLAKSSIERFYSRRDEDENIFLRADQIMRLEETADYPFVTAYLADVQGYQLVPLPNSEGQKDLLGHFRDINAAHADVVKSFADTLAHRTDDVRQAKAMYPQVKSSIKEMCELYQALNDLINEGDTS